MFDSTIEIIKPIIKSSTDFVFLIFDDTLNALYIKAIIQIVNRSVAKITIIVMKMSDVETSTASPIPRYSCNICCEYSVGDLGMPVRGANRYGKRAKACVPKISMILILDLENDIPNK